MADKFRVSGDDVVGILMILIVIAVIVFGIGNAVTNLMDWIKSRRSQTR